MTFYIDPKMPDSSSLFARLLKKCINSHTGSWSEIVFLCIGSDRMTGDCLGPYVGQQLQQLKKTSAFVYGTLCSPVHAMNLEGSLCMLHQKHPHALVIAIDASLGRKEQLGYITLGTGPLRPGSGVRKSLPPVGDIHITGIVNLSGALEQLTLQTTRLSQVIRLADIISEGILKVFQAEKKDSTADIPCPQYCPDIQACNTCIHYFTKSLI